MSARSAKRDLDLEILTNAIATLHNRVIELEGGNTSAQPVYYNPGQRGGTLVTFDTHQTTRDKVDKDVLVLVPLLENVDQQQ